MKRMLKGLAGERGTALMETAMGLPLVLLVSVAIFEFGRAFETWEILVNAAREGARVAILPNSATSDVTSRCVSYMQMGYLSNASTATVSVSTVPISIGTGTANASQVTISYPFTFMVLQPVANLVVNGSTLGSPITLTATAVMRDEAQ